VEWIGYVCLCNTYRLKITPNNMSTELTIILYNNEFLLKTLMQSEKWIVDELKKQVTKKRMFYQ
jgi:hypothetical protein